MEHITVEYYRAGTPYISPEGIEEIIQSRGTVKNACRVMADRYSTSTRRIYEIWKRHAEGIPLRKQQPIHSVVSSEIIPENNTSDRKPRKRKPGSGSKSDSVRLTQNRREREEAKRETKRVLDPN
ncbi:14980_t:CDS:2 [Acaulospora morrowiae]|uniref:14980_t:CDS:1 n=1 Tax=Acaulospora morrowiae TaxID=94023 RepID=A0A9N9NI69_9GLOM|nr:14980_t:CDS:2 [Acaulospora morrowiae]